MGYERLPNPPVTHDMYVLGDKELRTVSYLDEPMQATGDARQALVDRGRDPGQFLPALRLDCLMERREIMELASDEEGLDMQRVRGFVARYGGQQKAVRVLAPDQYRQVHGVQYVTATPYVDSQGAYRTAPDIALVERDQAREERFGSVHTEAIIVHELLGHGWCEPRYAGSAHNRGDHFVAGFTGPNGNNALEEGWALYVEAMYRQEYGVVPGTSYSRFGSGLLRTLRLGEVSGRWVKYEMVSQALANGANEQEPTSGSAPSIHAASILERVIDRDPDFLQLLCEARTSEPHLALVRERLNGIVPGLYERLVGTRPYKEASRWSLKALDAEVELRLASRRERLGLAGAALILRGIAALQRRGSKP